ncbi:MAG: IS701 family transposase, partial [Phycisphaerae bacterium]
GGIGVIDGSGHAKRGVKTPGVQRQYCGETGKIDNCVIGQHLLFTDDDPSNPFCCMLQSDLYLPKSWSEDRTRCQDAGIPDAVVHQPRWKMAVQQTKNAISCGVKFNGLVFDEEYGQVPDFWLAMDQLGLWATGEVPSNFRAWVKRPACESMQACHAARQVDHLTRHSPAFARQDWHTCTVKAATRGPVICRYKAVRVHLAIQDRQQDKTVPTDRRYWLILMEKPVTGEIKYVISNVPESVSPDSCLRMLLSRWHIEKWFERAKQEAGMGAFEVRNYTSLIRHWLCVRIAMCFLSEQTTRLRGEKSVDNLRTGDPCGGQDSHGVMVAGLSIPTMAA